MSKLRLILLHYHLLPGGVTSVLRDSLSALARYGRWSEIDVLLLVGSEQGIVPFLDQVQKKAGSKLNINIECWPSIGYHDHPWVSRESFLRDVKRLSSRLERTYVENKSDLLWVHNPTVGKNSALTEALRLLAQRRTDLRILYHIHDFAECSRFDNLRRLHHCWGSGGLKRLYPLSPSVTLIILTEADRNRLLASGYPAEAVQTLPDPVESHETPEPFSTDERHEMDQRLGHWSRRQEFQYQSGSKWLLAPIRTIRRKNVLELGLLGMLLGEQWQLLVTLDANSKPERPYAEFVKKCFRKESLQASLGFGPALLNEKFSFGRLYQSADVIATTSVLEGFGLAFAESVLAGQPLIGRNLPDVTSGIVGLEPTHLYNQLSVPLSDGERKRLLDLYRKRIDNGSSQAQLSTEIRDTALESFSQLLKAGTVDFAYLDLPAQARVIHAMSDKTFRNEVEKINEVILSNLRGTLNRPTADQQAELTNRIGFQPFTKRFQAILDSPSVSIPEEDGEYSRRLSEIFFKPEFLPLILESGDDWRLWPSHLLPRFIGQGRSQKISSPPNVSLEHSPRVVLWDVYGTLLVPSVGDLEQRLQQRQSPEAYREALSAAGLDISQCQEDLDKLFKALIEETHSWGRRNGQQQPEVVIENVWQRLVRIALPGQWIGIDQARFIAAWFELSTNQVHLRPVMDKVVAQLSRMGIVQGILSNSQFYTPEILKYLLGATNWAAFDPNLLIWSYKLGAAKPDPAPFAHARSLLRARGFKPDRVILVGDSLPNDIVPAKAWGWKAIQLLHPDALAAPTDAENNNEERQPDFRCDNLADLFHWLAEAW